MASQTQPGVLAGRRLNQVVAGAFGAVFVIVGLLGFTVSGGHQIAGHDGGQLLGLFGVNVLHNLVHLAIGAVLVAAAVAGVQAARSVNAVIGATYLLLGVVGLFITGGNPANIIAINGADNALHLVLGAILLGAGLGADRR
ncbi:MAG TPA: DUF4383 domain-containing protein [Planosporangium sp.]|jgi:hypothetical protein|nr:DUF4383 domain-containing protein [Planosporangium sp.]